MPLASLLLDALFPDACLACLAPRDASFRHEVACDTCLRGVRLPSAFSCGACGTVAQRLTPLCHPAAHVTLALPEERAVEQLVASLLYEGIYRTADPLAELAAAAAVSAGTPLHRAYVAPVPELPATLRERGYEANDLLARGVARSLDLAFSPHLLSVSRAGGRVLYGINIPGEAASADLIALVSVELASSSLAQQLAALARAACPHARVLFIGCAA